jgi:hypothetical protein
MSSVIVQPDIIVVVQVGQQGPKGATGFPAWTTATRPVAPALGDAGFNTTFSGVEVWTSMGWQTLSGIWTFGSRPSTTNLAPGSRGFNTEIGPEYWNGEEWRS